METQNFIATTTVVEDDDFDMPVMNMHIVRLNELLKIKASSINKRLRPTLQVVKYIAREIRDNWDDAKRLQSLKIDNATATDIWNAQWGDVLYILESRRKDLQPKEEDSKTEPKKEAGEAVTAVSEGKRKVGRKKINRPEGTVHLNDFCIWTELEES